MTKKAKFQTPTGVHDILPEEHKIYQKIFQTARNVLEFYSFSQMETPLFEESALFEGGIGQATEIVQKQMYTFRTRGGDSLTLRPEATTSIARAYIQHGMQNLPQPVKLWCFGPFYRYEKPQAGRYRQFYQLDAEVLGEGASVIDAQIIQVFIDILSELKIKDIVVEVNSIGDSQCRPYYKKQLVSYLRHYKAALCAECKRRFKENPLRIMDCKEEKCQRIVRQAPQFVDHLCDNCKAHFKEVLEFLDELGVHYMLNPYLVRGLDYYTRTIFEIFLKDEGEGEDKYTARNALVGGGRYDNLIRIIGGKDVPASGGAMGVERLINLIQKKNIQIAKPLAVPAFFVVQLGLLAKRKSLRILEEFRRARIAASESLSKDSLRAQLKLADRAGCKYALIIGQKEALDNEVMIRDMITGKQETVKAEKIVETAKKLLK